MSFSVAGYENPELVGTGGFGSVYRVWQPELSRHVAVKILTGSDMGSLDAVSRARFERERNALGALSDHPHIVTVFESGFDRDGCPYLVMEYLPDGSMASMLADRGPLSAERLLDVGVKLAGALETAHRRGVIHRDVKPENILVSSYGEPLVADFGVATIQGGHETTSRVITATINHAAPEVLSGDRPTVSSDIYSLASTLHTLASGRPPFSRENDDGLVQLIARIATEEPPAIEGLPDHAAAVLRLGLAKHPSERPQSMGEFADALREAQRASGFVETPVVVGRDAASDGAPNTTRVVDSDSSSAEDANGDGRLGARSRLRALALAAGGLLAVAAVIALAIFTGSGSDSIGGGDDVAAAGTTAPTEVASDDPDLEPESGRFEVLFEATSLVEEHQWNFDPVGQRVSETILVRNDSGAPTIHQLDVIVPKTLARTLGDVVFVPRYDSVVDPDPIVRYCIELEAGETFELTWSVAAVEADLAALFEERLEIQEAAPDAPDCDGAEPVVLPADFDFELDLGPTPMPEESTGPTPTEVPTRTPAQAAAPPPTPTFTPTPTATPTNTPTATPTNTPTATPTNTPTATPTSAPMAPPLPSFVGGSRDAAYNWLAANGLSGVCCHLRRDSNPGISDFTVLAQQYPAGTVLPLGTSVRIISKDEGYCSVNPDECTW